MALSNNELLTELAKDRFNIGGANYVSSQLDDLLHDETTIIISDSMGQIWFIEVRNKNRLVIFLELIFSLFFRKYELKFKEIIITTRPIAKDVSVAGPRGDGSGW